jgi:hypothetical protein
MDYRDTQYNPTSDDSIVCDICGATIAMGSEYVSIAAEAEDGAIVGTIVAHAQCAETLSQEQIAQLLGGTVGTDEDEVAERLPLARCCLCAEAIGERAYINLIERMFPGDLDGPLVATTFHMSCYRDDPDGVQRALEEEIMKQRQRRLHERLPLDD